MKKIAMIIPSLLLTSCLFSCEKGRDPFVIESEEKFNEAISLTAKDIEYVQVGRLYAYIGGIVYINYDEHYISPTVYNIYARTIYTSSSPTPPTEKYVEKTKEHGEDAYYMYTKDSEKWKREKCPSDEDFMTPTKLGESIKYTLGLGSVTYDTIKDKYDKYRQAYYFDVANVKGYPYSVILSFYNNRLNYFSYNFYDEKTDGTECGASSFTYGLVTPKLPEVDDPTL